MNTIKGKIKTNFYYDTVTFSKQKTNLNKV